MGVLFIWKDTYSVGNAEIDGQHRQIFTLANLVSADLDTKGINAAIMALFRYVREHFTAEEKMMKEIGYPETSSHRDLHEALITRLSELATHSFQNGEALTEFRQFVYTWVIDHILNQDMKYIRFAQVHLPGAPLPMAAVALATGAVPDKNTVCA
jgi:hemerythrin-like metal-binding protein